MKDEEIKKIAYYICEKRHKEEEISDSTTFIFPIDIYADIVAKLSERYCIVEKSKVEALHEEIHGEIMCAHDDDDWQSASHYILDVMPITFVDIFGKDIFKEEEK